MYYQRSEVSAVRGEVMYYPYVPPSFSPSSLSLSLPLRVGRIFTEETIARLQREAGPEEGDGGGDKSGQNDSQPATSCGLLWHMAWCPLLQVMTVLPLHELQTQHIS